MVHSQRVRTALVVGATAFMIPSLVSCSTSGSDSRVTVTESASFTTTVTEAPTSDTAAAAAPAAESPSGTAFDDRGQAPCAATSYTPDAEKDLVDEGVTKEEVDEVLRQACSVAKWDNDGYWEVEWADIEVEIYPDGTVRDVDR